MIEITDGVHERHRQQAGLIYYEAFRRKLQPLVGRPAETREVPAAGLNLGMALGVLIDGDCAAWPVCITAAASFRKSMRVTPWRGSARCRGLYAWAALNLFAGGNHCPGR